MREKIREENGEKYKSISKIYGFQKEIAKKKSKN